MHRHFVHEFVLGVLVAAAPVTVLAPGTASAAGSATVATYRHGDPVTIPGSFGNPDVTHSFLGGAAGPIESTAAGHAPPSGGGWTFNNLGGPTTVRMDPDRGKVLFTPEDANNYNATRRFDSGAGIDPQRFFYKAHFVRNVLLLDGAPYPWSYQWKHERVHWLDSVTDSNCEVKVHDWPDAQGPETIVTREDGSNQTFWGGARVDSNSGWAMMELMVYTGTRGQNDGKVITRIFKNGHTYIGQNQQAARVYAAGTQQLRYFVEQNYFGNFAQMEFGVDNDSPRPQVRQVWSDDSLVIVGRAPGDGWQRVELRDAVALQDATMRVPQSWTSWNGSIQLDLNTDGLPPGEHDLYLVVVDGIDAQGWDVVDTAMPIHVQVDEHPLFADGFEQ